MISRDRYPQNYATDDKLQRIAIWKWGIGGGALWGIGSVLILRASWYTVDSISEHVTFVGVNALIGAVLGLLAGWFAMPTTRREAPSA
jgi:hypothetical protein